MSPRADGHIPAKTLRRRAKKREEARWHLYLWAPEQLSPGERDALATQLYDAMGGLLRSAGRSSGGDS